MNEDIRAFLSKFSVEELEGQNILVPSRLWGYLLRAASVDPLIELMRKHSVTRLEAIERNWFLTSEYEFQNPWSAEYRHGDARQLKKPGNVFNEQNRHINPYFRGSDGSDVGQVDGGSSEGGAAADAITFALERDLQSALRSHIEQLEPGLKIIDGGRERIVEAGRIDITAEDAEGRLVVIELKAGTAPPDSMTQLLAYMGSITHEADKPVRGILLARNFHQRVVFAAQAVPNVQLKEYSFRFSFEDK